MTFACILRLRHYVMSISVFKLRQTASVGFSCCAEFSLVQLGSVGFRSVGR